MISIIKNIAGLIFVVAALLIAVEEDEDTQEEKEIVKEKFKKIVEKYGEDNLPGFVVSILTREEVIEGLIEAKLWALRRADFLQ